MLYYQNMCQKILCMFVNDYKILWRTLTNYQWKFWIVFGVFTGARESETCNSVWLCVFMYVCVCVCVGHTDAVGPQIKLYAVLSEIVMS